MLYIQAAKEADGRENWIPWHVGDIVPNAARQRVVTFQADGHELEMFLKAMQYAMVDRHSEVCFPGIRT